MVLVGSSRQERGFRASIRAFSSKRSTGGTNDVYCCDCVTVNTSLFYLTYRLPGVVTFHWVTCKLQTHVEEDRSKVRRICYCDRTAKEVCYVLCPFN